MNTRQGRIVFLSPFCPQNDEAANNEGAGHHHRREQVFFDRLAEKQTEHHRGHKSHQHIQRKLLGLFFSRQGCDGVADFLPVNQNHRKDGTGLDGDVKDLGLLIVKTQQCARQNQVTRGRNGKKFRQAFNNAHDGGFDQQCNVHRGSSNGIGLSP